MDVKRKVVCLISGWYCNYSNLESKPQAEQIQQGEGKPTLDWSMPLTICHLLFPRGSLAVTWQLLFFFCKAKSLNGNAFSSLFKQRVRREGAPCCSLSRRPATECAGSAASGPRVLVFVPPSTSIKTSDLLLWVEALLLNEQSDQKESPGSELGTDG